MTIANVRLLIFGWLALLFSICTGIVCVLPAYLMNSVGVSCPATVLCLSLEQPRGFQYSYVVNGITYQHFAFQSEFPGIHVGSKIDVHYRRDQPEISSARNTAKELENQIVFDVVTSIALPLALCFLVVERLCRFHLSFIALFGPSGRSTSK